MSVSKRLGSAAILFPLAAGAHELGPLHPDDVWRAWSFEPGVLVCLGATALLYACGARMSRGVSRTRMFSFWGGMLMLVLALISPVHALGGVLFSAHMAQHEILMLAAAPLLAFAHPLPSFLWALPIDARRTLGRWAKAAAIRRVWRTLTKPVHAWWLHAIVLWVWHAPGLFDMTLRSEAIHTAQHLSFFLSALCFWWALFQAHTRPEYGHGVFYIFTTAIHTGILGALLTFSPSVVYPVYSHTTQAFGLTPLEDQQIGGLIMWVPAGVAYMAVGLALFWAWIREPEASVRSDYAD
jgi:putative membrane protein